MLGLLASVVALPWLQGFEPIAVADHASLDAQRELTEWQDFDEGCIASAYGGLRLVADVAPAQGDETLLASFTQGVVVLDQDRHAIARAPGYACRGSADELVAVAAGDAGIGTPLIAIAATSGGHNENLTWLALYRVGDRGELVEMFRGVVERHTKHMTRTGTVVFFEGGLLYRPPSGAPSLWLYDRDRGVYVEQLALPGVV